jgi:hypothetical protein
VAGGERTCGGVTSRILDSSLGVLVLIGCCDGPDVGRSLGAILTSVFVVKRSVSPFDCGSRETAGIQYMEAPNLKFII